MLQQRVFCKLCNSLAVTSFLLFLYCFSWRGKWASTHRSQSSFPYSKIERNFQEFFHENEFKKSSTRILSSQWLRLTPARNNDFPLFHTAQNSLLFSMAVSFLYSFSRLCIVVYIFIFIFILNFIVISIYHVCVCVVISF